MKKTDILELVSRKLAPFMFLFGLYLLTYGHLSPGGGFQGGVVIASGIILLSVSRGIETAEALFPSFSLSILETFCFILLLAAGLAGVFLGVGFLGNPLPRAAAAGVPRVGMILLLNILVGLKVAAGVSLICLRFFREDE
ncbi:MAG: sodium:proton antiporter [Spirochaetales bacterium]|nr:sodium:proton antiporter [Spirochaetales bacterium]